MKKVIIPFFLAFILSACSDKASTPHEVAEQFWDAAQHKKLESAKQWVNWQTVSYLKYLSDDALTIKRVEYGESEVNDEWVAIDTVLIVEKEKGSDIRIPTKTVLVKTESGWKVQLKKTLSAVINQSINAAANQFNQILQQGMQEFNKALSGSMNDISTSLEEGAKELGDALEGNAKQFGDSFNQFQRELEKSTKDAKGN